MEYPVLAAIWGNNVFPGDSAMDIIDAANLTSCGVSNIARKLWTRGNTR